MQDLIELMHHLRQHCPWDRAQTALSLTPYAIEEAYEVEAAVRSGQLDDIQQELGDLLFQVLFQAEIYAEQGAFNFADITTALKEKLIRRHPHVFATAESTANETTANQSAANTEQLAAQWQAIKQREKQARFAMLNPLQRAVQHSLLSHIKPGPALLQAQQIQQRAATVGFDFDHVDDATAKLHEELAELAQVVTQQNVANIEDEFGDCLFALINIGRKLNVNSEAALLGTIHKFRQRFAYIEQQAQQQHKALDQLSLAEMDALWCAAKQL